MTPSMPGVATSSDLPSGKQALSRLAQARTAFGTGAALVLGDFLLTVGPCFVVVLLTGAR